MVFLSLFILNIKSILENNNYNYNNNENEDDNNNNGK